MLVKFIQTADAFRYKPMLEITSRTVVEYCRRHGFEYESFVGIKRGFHAWQASFNRLLMFAELVETGFDGWVVYLDADAYIYDLDFDLRAYLADKADRAGVLTTVLGSADPWMVNNGVMMVNLGHPVARETIRRWNATFAAVPDQTLRDLVDWPGDINDQTFLCDVLGADATLHTAYHYERIELINHPYGTFIRQLLRAFLPALEERIAALRNAVDEVMGDPGGELSERVYPVMISALFRVLLQRDPEPGVLEHFRGRFQREGAETAFRETLAEFLMSREYRERESLVPVAGAQRVRAAHRWLLGRNPSEDELREHADALDRGQLDWTGLRLAILRGEEFAAHFAEQVPQPKRRWF